MTLPHDQPIAHHLGFAAHDAEALAKTYSAMLGAAFRFANYPVHNLRGEPAMLKVAYGAVAGLVLEIIEIAEGDMPQTAWLEKHGEGIQHIGFWVPDVPKATEQALRRGATIEWIYENGTEKVIQLRSGASVEDIVAEVSPASLTYLDMPRHAGSVAIEFIGPSIQQGMIAPGSILEGRGELITARPTDWFTKDT